MSDITMTDGRSIEKIKVVNPHIVVYGTVDKPYYVIEYYDLVKQSWYVGYGTDNLDCAFKWLNTCFEVIVTKEEIIEAYEALTKDGCVTIHDNTNNLVTIKI